MRRNLIKEWADKHPEAVVWTPEHGWVDQAKDEKDSNENNGDES
jgi:hypothetical protein